MDLEIALNWSPFIAIAGAIGAAVLGFWLWRVQLIAQRRFEVAEEAIISYTMADFALSYARNGASFAREGTTRPVQEGETEELADLRNVYFTPIERLVAADSRFAELTRIALLARHHLGSEAYDSFETLRRARQRVIVSAQMLVRWAGDSEDGPPDSSLRELRRKCRDDIWGGSDPNNEMTKELKHAEETLRTICDREAQMNAAIWPFRGWRRSPTRSALVEFRKASVPE